MNDPAINDNSATANSPSKYEPDFLQGPGHIVLGLRPLEPWPEPVDGAVLLNNLTRNIKRFAVLPRWVAETLALWIIHTFAFHLRDVSTYIGIDSPTRRCGKSTVVRLLSKLASRAVVSSNISSPAFFRVIEELQPTLFIDEADALLPGNDELRGILNAGYSRDGSYIFRVASERPDESKPSVHTDLPAGNSPERNLRSSRLLAFSCWCPKVISTKGRLPDTLADRCIMIHMQRKTRHEKCERIKNLDALTFRRQCSRFVADHGEIASAQPLIPESLNDRAADIWETLFSVADSAGGEWPQIARNAAEALSGSDSQEGSPIGTLLLDAFMAFTNAATDRLFSRQLLAALQSQGERPWTELTRGKTLNETWLARQLSPFGIKSRLIRDGDEVARGYLCQDFTEPCRRYIAKSEFDALKQDLLTQNPKAPPPSPPEPTPPPTQSPQPPPGPAELPSDSQT